MVQELLVYSLLALLCKRHSIAIPIAIAACNSPQPHPLLLAEPPDSCKVLYKPMLSQLFLLCTLLQLCVC